MNIIVPAGERRKHIESAPNNEIICNENAVEAAILDRWGKAIWQKARGQDMVPLRWNGLDSAGSKVKAGSYLCKIIYPDNLVVYVPFVFI
jgi:hypothetical protein